MITTRFLAPALALAAVVGVPVTAPAVAQAQGDLGAVQAHLRTLTTMTADFSQTDRAGKVLTGTLIAGAALAVSACGPSTESTTTDNTMVTDMNTTGDMGTMNDSMTTVDSGTNTGMMANDTMMSNDTMIGLADEGMTMLCVTHEMGFARRVADRVIFMADGRIVEQAPPEQFFTQPQDPRTKNFLGQILTSHHQPAAV